MKTEKTVVRAGRLFSMDFICILLLAFLNSTIYQSFTTVIPLFSTSIGGDNVVAGLLVAIYMVGAIAIRPIWGYLADTKSRYVVVILGASLVALSRIGYNFAATIPVLMILRLVQGIGFSGNTNTTATMAADVIPEKRMSEGIGYYGLANVLATAIGPTLALSVSEGLGFSSFFKICTVVAFVCVLLACTIRYEKKQPKVSCMKKVLYLHRLLCFLYLFVVVLCRDLYLCWQLPEVLRITKFILWYMRLLFLWCGSLPEKSAIKKALVQ